MLSVPSSVDQDLVDERAGRAHRCRRATVVDLVVDVGDGPLHALAAVAVVAVAQLDRLVLARRRARGDDGSSRAPDSSTTSTSTVGLPRESSTSRPRTVSISLTLETLVGEVPPAGALRLAEPQKRLRACGTGPVVRRTWSVTSWTR